MELTYSVGKLNKGVNSPHMYSLDYKKYNMSNYSMDPPCELSVKQDIAIKGSVVLGLGGSNYFSNIPQLYGHDSDFTETKSDDYV